MIRVIGLDLSLTSTGIARLELDEHGTITGSHTDTVTSGPPEEQTLPQRVRRVDYVAGCVMAAALGAYPRWEIDPVQRPHLIVVEGASFGSTTGQAQERAWLRGAVYLGLYELGLECVEVAPTSLKLYATGNGRASKTHVVQSVRQHYGEHFDIPLCKADGREDVADAIALVAMGARSIGHPIDPDHPKRTRAMRTPKWTHRKDT